MNDAEVNLPGGLAPVLAERLLELIVRERHPAGQRLPEQALADELGVSRSPVRKALQYLAGLNVIGYKMNRGFFLCVDSEELRSLVIPGSDASEEAHFMRIAEDRLTGTLSEEISESELMARYGLSRLHVQRVLNRMCREGLADRKAGRGWAFGPALNTVQSHRESYRFRMVIEPAAIMEPTFRVDRAAFARVRQQQQQLLDGGIETWSASERFRAGAELHEAIVASSGNRFLLDALRQVNQLRRVLEYHLHARSTQDRQRLYLQCQEHLQLLDLLEAGERLEAFHALRKHLDVVRNIKTGAPALGEARTAG